jgi:chemotaxis protein MotB
MSHAPASGRARRRKGGHDEEHENHERWLVTYADMLTLLMVLFIVLFAMSQVDQVKFKVLANSLAAGFGTPAPVLAGGTGPNEGEGDNGTPIGSTPDSPVNVDSQLQSVNQKSINDAAKAADLARQQKLAADAAAEAKHFEEIRKELESALRKQGLQSSVQYRVTEQGLVVSVVTDKVVFDGDSAVLRPDGAKILTALGPTLAHLPNELLVVGHTNHLGVSNPLYPTLWELSVARAARVVRFLIETQGVTATRLEAAGFGKERPLYPATDPRAIAQNRRVEIVVESPLPSESAALLPTVSTVK